MRQILGKCLICMCISICFTACEARERAKESADQASDTTKHLDGTPTLVKTRNSQSGDNVHCSLEDQSGNLWFGTTGEGLYIFDGSSFRQYTDASPLRSNTVYSIFEDSDGRIWIGTGAGLCLYEGGNFKNIQIPLPADLPPNKHRRTHDVFDIIQDQHGKLWFATIDGVFVNDGVSFKPFVIDADGVGFMSSNHNVERMVEDKAGNLWFGGRGNEGVFRYDGASITNLKVNGDGWAIPALADKNGYIWFSNWDGAFVYDGDSFTQKVGLTDGRPSPVTGMIEGENGIIWFGGGGRGLCQYDWEKITCLNAEDGLSNEDVWSILEDSSGNLWLGTRNTGLFRYDGEGFTSFSDFTVSKAR